MNPHTHALFGLFVALGFYRAEILSWPLVAVSVLVAVFIDLDHYVMHIKQATHNRFSVLSMWNTSMYSERFPQRSVLHRPAGVLALTGVLIIVSFFSPLLALAFALGLYSHMFLDVINEVSHRFVHWRLGPVHMRSTLLNFCVDIVSVIGIFFLF